MLKPEQIKTHRFISNTRGAYEADDVDNFFAEVTESYEQMFRENGELVKKISLLADRVSQYRNDEDNIRRALLTAERMAAKIQKESEETAKEKLDAAEKTYNDMVAAAQSRADVLETAAQVKASQLTDESKKAATERVTNAEKTASSMISEAESKANEIIEDAKSFAQKELDRINNEIKVNTVTLNALSNEVESFKATLVESFKKNIAMIENLPRKADFVNAQTEEDANKVVNGMDDLSEEEVVVKAAEVFAESEEEASEETTFDAPALVDVFASDDTSEDSAQELSIDLSEIEGDMQEEENKDESGEDKSSLFKGFFKK